MSALQKRLSQNWHSFVVGVVVVVVVVARMYFIFSRAKIMEFDII